MHDIARAICHGRRTFQNLERPHFESIHAYLQAKSTGQLSIVTYIFNLGGCVIRIFTSIQEGAGIAMVRGFILGRLLAHV